MYQRFQRFYQYDIDSNEKVLESLRSVPEQSSEHYQKALDIFSHMHAARQLWLNRMTDAIASPDALFPVGTTLEQSETWFRKVNDAWRPFIDELSDAQIRRTFDYQSIEGDRFRSRIEDILTQLFGHGWYHRGQIASLTKRAGGKPAVTDWVYATREKI